MMAVASGLNDMRRLARPLPSLPATATVAVFAGLMDASGIPPDTAAGEAATVPSPLAGPVAKPQAPSSPDQHAKAAAASQPLPDGEELAVAETQTAPPGTTPVPPSAEMDIAATLTATRFQPRAAWSNQAISADAPNSAEPPSASPMEHQPDTAAINPVAEAVALPAQITPLGTDPSAMPVSQLTAPAPKDLATARAAAPDAAAAVRAPAVITGASVAVAAERPALRSNLRPVPGDHAATVPVETHIAAPPLTSWSIVADKASADQSSGFTEIVPPSASALPTSAPVTASQPAPLAGDAPLRLLDFGADDRWIASLAQDIAALQADDGLLRFQLLPRHLGRLEVSVQTGSEGILVRVAAENAAAQSMLAGAQNRLVDDLRNNGVRIAAAEIGMQAQGWTDDRLENDRSHPDQRWNFVETGHAADPVPLRTRRSGADRLA